MTRASLGRERRIRQFEHYLGLMEHRSLRVVKSDCFLVFSVPMPIALRPRFGDSVRRIVQFAFTMSDFYIDLPDTTVTPEEAQVVVQRPGFLFALTKTQKTLGERQCDPVQRRYQYDAKRAAAEDVAFVLFDLWRTPVDSWINVDAATFDGASSWEQEFSMG